MKFEDYIGEGTEFKSNHSPYKAVTEKSKAGFVSHMVRNQHSQSKEPYAKHNSIASAKEHADMLNHEHREKHGIKHP